MSKETPVNHYVLYAYWYRVFIHVTVAILTLLTYLLTYSMVQSPS